MEFGIEEIEQKLNTFSTKAEKLNYLNNYLFGLKKKKVEFNTFDEKTLTRLTTKTAKDFEKYQNEFDRGNLIYWTGGKTDITKAKKIGIENLDLLKQRLSLELKLSDLQGRIQIFESLIERVEKETLPPANPETNLIAKDKFYTDKDFSALIQELEKLPVNRVNDILEHHYTQAYFPHNMARFNWLNQLRTILIKAYPVKAEKPMQILLANHWVDNIISKHVHDVNAKANNWLSDEEIRKANQDNRTDLLNRLTIVKYFEEGNIKVQLFGTGNEHFKAQGKLDNTDIWEAENSKTDLEIKEAWRTRDLLHLESIHEADENELEALFIEKFTLAKGYKGFKTEAKFAKHEIELHEWEYNKYFKWFPILEQWFELLKAKAGQTDTQQPAIQTPLIISEAKPTFNPESIAQVFEILKDFFSTEQQPALKQILQTGGNASKKLIFKSNGNRLADAFKQLINTDLITGCQKKELENWVNLNFRYIHNKKPMDFKPRYLNDIISTNKEKCQNPLLNVTKDKATGRYVINKA